MCGDKISGLHFCMYIIIKQCGIIKGYGHFFHKQVLVTLWWREDFQSRFQAFDLLAHQIKVLLKCLCRNCRRQRRGVNETEHQYT